MNIQKGDEAMGDISLDKFLVGFIGISGLTICILASIQQPMEISDFLAIQGGK
jgi:hypothetical protein